MDALDYPDGPCTWCRRTIPASGLCECPHCGGEAWCDECLGAHAPRCGEEIAVEVAADTRDERLGEAGDLAYDEWRDEGRR